MGKLWVGCAASNFSKGRRGFTPLAIVVHIMDSHLAGTDAWFNDPRSSVSAHYGVGRDGAIHQYVAETDTAFHAGKIDAPTWRLIKRTASGSFINPNYYTIGIEHEGFAADTWPAAQTSTSAALIAEVAARWNIPRDTQHVIGHHEIRACRPCPGNTIDLAASLLNGIVAARQALPEGVKTVANANLRRGAASTVAPIAAVLGAGATFNAVDYTDAGEPVQGNPCWYKDANGNFLWAGVTNIPNPG